MKIIKADDTLLVQLNAGNEVPLADKCMLDDTYIKFVFDGRLDTVSAPIFEKFFASFITLSESNPVTDAELDFAKLSYLSSAGLRVLLVMHKYFYKLGGDMSIKNINKGVLEVMNITGFSGLLHIQ